MLDQKVSAMDPPSASEQFLYLLITKGIFFFVPFTLTIILYGIMRQNYSRKRALASCCVCFLLVETGFLLLTQDAYYSFSSRLFCSSCVLPAGWGFLIAGWLALKTKRDWQAFVVGLIVSPIIAVLLSITIFAVTEKILVPMRGGGEEASVGLGFAVLIPTMFYITIGWPIVAMVTAAMSVSLAKNRRS